MTRAIKYILICVLCLVSIAVFTACHDDGAVPKDPLIVPEVGNVAFEDMGDPVDIPGADENEEQALVS